jgi:hypothetical protein
MTIAGAMRRIEYHVSDMVLRAFVADLGAWTDFVVADSIFFSQGTDCLAGIFWQNRKKPYL